MRTRRWKGWRWLAGSLIGLGVALFLAGGMLVAISLAEAEDGTGAAATLEGLIRRDERLHYEVHLMLGRMLSLCPCTRGRASVEFTKAAYHVPEDVRFRRELTARFPEAPRQVNALLACQDAVRARLRARGVDVAFPKPTEMAKGDLNDAVFDSVAGTLNVSQPVHTRPAGAPAGQIEPGFSTVYTCDLRPGPAGGWVIDRMSVLD